MGSRPSATIKMQNNKTDNGHICPNKLNQYPGHAIPHPLNNMTKPLSERLPWNGPESAEYPILPTNRTFKPENGFFSNSGS